MVKFLKIKDILMKKDSRESNLLRNPNGSIIGYTQSKYVCQFVLEDSECGEYIWVAKNDSIATALELIGENEDQKYDVEEKNKNRPWNSILLGRNLFFLSHLYPIYEKFLMKCGFKPNHHHMEKAKKFKNSKTDYSKNRRLF